MKKRLLSVIVSLVMVISLVPATPITVFAALYYSDHYAVPIDSYQSFRNAVINKAYNVDGDHGAQCWDGACILWRQIGSNLQTGNGRAYGCWTLKKEANAGDSFDLIYNIENVKRGDVVVFSAGENGHIGFADEDYNGSGYIALLGQNQGNGLTKVGAGDSDGNCWESAFNITDNSVSSFKGAFRYKGWGGEPSVPQGSEMTSGYDRILPNGDYIIVNVGTKDKGSYYYLDAQGSKFPADNETNVHLWGPTTDISSYDVWTISYSSGFYSIKQKGTNMALDVYGASRFQGANVQVYQSHSTAAQKWAISHNDRNGYRIQAKCSGMSLDVNGGGTVAGTNIQQWTNNDSDAQSWLFIPYNPTQPIANGRYVISSALDSNKIVSTDFSEDIQNIFISSKGENIGDSVFEITKLDNGYYKVIHCSSGKALTVSGGFSTVNTNVALSIDNNTIAKQWAIIAYNGKYKIISRCNGYALDITKASTSDGTNIAMYRRHTNSNQQWSFEPAEVTVKFDANGGSSVSSVKVTYGNNLSVLPQTSRNGYTFLGWYTSKTGGSKLTTSTKITSNVTYYAHWYNPCENGEHSWGSWTVTTPATCTANGEEIRVCARDASHIETRKIDALGHNYSANWSKSSSQHWHECSGCHDKKDLANHTMVNGKCSVCGYIAEKVNFPDVSYSAWYGDSVAYAVGSGLMTGYASGKFGTADGIQRQDFVVILARLSGADLSVYEGQKAFKDVDPNAYYAPALAWAKVNGVSSGYNDGSFGVGNKVTREQIMTFLHNYAKLQDYDVTVTDAEKAQIRAQYSDFKNVSSYAQEATYWALKNGVISGKEVNGKRYISPGSPAQRCEVAAMFYNINQKEIFV